MLQCCACYLINIKSNPMHHLSSALPLQYVLALVTHGALVAHRHSFRILGVRILSTAEPLCPSRRLFGMILVILCLMVWDWRVLRAEAMLSWWPNLLFIFVSYCFLFFFFYRLVVRGWVFGLIECSHSLLTLHCFNNNNNNNTVVDD